MIVTKQSNSDNNTPSKLLKQEWMWYVVKVVAFDSGLRVHSFFKPIFSVIDFGICKQF